MSGPASGEDDRRQETMTSAPDGRRPRRLARRRMAAGGHGWRLQETSMTGHRQWRGRRRSHRAGQPRQPWCAPALADVVHGLWVPVHLRQRAAGARTRPFLRRCRRRVHRTETGGFTQLRCIDCITSYFRGCLLRARTCIDCMDGARFGFSSVFYRDMQHET